MNWNKKNLLAIVVAILIVAAMGKLLGKLYKVARPTQENSFTTSIVEANKTNQPIVQTKQVMEIKVRPGWCLSRIAEGLGTSTEDLVKMNQIKDPNFIRANETLKVDPYNRINEVEVSWYGSMFHGRKMSNGKTFNMYDPMTVAHKLLLFDTEVRLTRVDNQKSIIVTIRDRGPYIRGRHFDLSYGAAKKLGIIDLGVVMCRVEILN